MTQFDLVGTIKAIQSKGDFNSYAVQTFQSGWQSTRLLYNVQSGDNRYMMTIQGGRYPNDNYTIKTLSQATAENGKRDMLEIPWKDRMNQDVIDKVANFRKFTVDMNYYGVREKLHQFATRIHEGTPITDEELKSVGLTDESQVADAVKRADMMYKQFISELDFAEFMHKLLEKGFCEGKKFHITGVIEKQWSDRNQRWYSSMKPQRIYLANDDAEEYCKANAILYFGEGAVDESAADEKGKIYITAHTLEYDSSRKKNIFADFQLVIPTNTPTKTGVHDEHDIDRAKKIASKFMVEGDGVYEYGVEFELIDGPQKTEITEDMLSDSQREDLELGIITMDEIRAEMGNTVYGERLTENRYCGVYKGYTRGAKETSYTKDQFAIPAIEDDELPFGTDDSDDTDTKPAASSSSLSDSDLDDLFN